ncbi:MAG: guanylate kinase [Proteobacteria bacterium]|nr:guanylate kinase [Pseudomonadota bacterium]
MSQVFIVSAPSGTGKTTLNTKLARENSCVEISISHTTRTMRSGEIQGQSYHFVDRDVFQQMILRGEMLEWAEVFGNLYGTSKQEIDRITKDGKKVLLEIDVQGARSVLMQLSTATSIFILPPSVEELWRRLENRGTDRLDDRWKRLMTAKHEIEVGYLYEHFLINDDRDKAFDELKKVIIEGKHSSLTHSEGVKLCQNLLEEFDTSPLLHSLREKMGEF